MKPYGIPRNMDVQWPDQLDCVTYAFKDSRAKVKGLGGDRHSIMRNKAAKAATRRYWKRKARKAAEKEIKNELED